MKAYAIPIRPFVAGIFVMLLILLSELAFEHAAGTAAYVLVSLFILWCARTTHFIVAVGIAGSIFLLAIFATPIVNSQTDPAIIANRIISVGVIWLAVFFTIRFSRLHYVERMERRQFKALVDHANEGILLINTSGKILLANPAAEKIFGYDPYELTGRAIDGLIPERFKSWHSEQVAQFLHAPSSRSIGRYLNGLRKDGSEFHVDISLSHFYDKAEVVVIAFVLDATDRVKNEEIIQSNLKSVSDYSQELETKVEQRTSELVEANQELLKTQMVYRSMAHNFPDGFIGIMDKDLRYILVDGKGLVELGLNAETILGDSVFNDIPAAITSHAEGALRKVFTGESVFFDIQIEGKCYNISSVPIEIEDREIQEILVVVKDISAQKNLERELVKTLEKEKELNILKSRFVTMASHEFRTPLTTILSSAFLLENYTGQQLEAEKKKHLDRIKRSVHGLTELLNDFLSLGKLEEGIVQVAYKPMQLREFGEQLLHEVSLLKKENQRIVFEFEGEDAEVLMDKQLLRNILLNLLSNAIKYSPASGNIGLTISALEKNIMISVTDHGIGIPPEEQKLIFKRFFRANNTSDIQGTGLGLNIVKRYVKLLKGRIEFNSRLNKGTTFTVTLPLNLLQK